MTQTFTTSALPLTAYCSNPIAQRLTEEYGVYLQEMQLQPLKELRAVLTDLSASRPLIHWRPYLDKEILEIAEQAQELSSGELEALIDGINAQITQGCRG